MGTQLRLLLVESSEDDAGLIHKNLTAGGYDLVMERVETRFSMETAIDAKEWDLIISEYSLPQFSGLGALDVCRFRKLAVPLIILSAARGEDIAVEMMRAGACDFLVKGNDDRLLNVVQRELQRFQGLRENEAVEIGLRNAELKFSKAFHISPDSVLICRLGDDIILDVNDSFTGMMGYSAAETVNRTTEEIGIWANREEYSRLVDEVKRNGELTNQEIPFRRKDGMVRIGLISAKAIDMDGEWGIITVTRDITERKVSEEKIQRQAQQLASLQSIDNAITSGFDMHMVLETLLEQVVEQLNVDAATVLMFDPQSQMLEYTASRGFKTGALRHTRLRLGEGHAGTAALQRRTLIIENLKEAGGSIARSISLEQEGFISYFSIPLIARRQLLGVLEVFHRKQIETNSDWLNFLEALVGQAAIVLDNGTMLNELQYANAQLMFAYDDTIQGLVRALELREVETAGHSHRVVQLAVQIAKELGFRTKDLVNFQRGAVLHDIGKIGIPDSVLLKPGPLTEEEWEVMRLHPTYAYNLLDSIAYLRPALEIPYCHHEHWDGSGYPRGIKGEEIPISARIFFVADVWDALRSDRPYRKAWDAEKAKAHIISEKGKLFDPAVVDAFLGLIPGE